MRKVRVGSMYVYKPVPLDVFDGRTGLKEGEVVKIVNCFGCPPANTMGHCFVGDKETGRFIGLVCCNSLVPLKEWVSQQREDARSERVDSVQQ
jgi:hypothetical protein